MASEGAKSAVAITLGTLFVVLFLGVVLFFAHAFVKQRAQQHVLEKLKETNPVEYHILHTPPARDDDLLKNDMAGTWKLAGAKSRRTGQFVFLAPGNYYFKMFTLTNWSIVAYDASSNVVYTAGGPYTLAGDNYTEIIQHATGSMKQYLGARPQFHIRAEGDAYYQMGAGRNPTVEEMWQRVQP
ncbi:MAG: hypothetical protein ACLQSR_16385 [Limisphaerales bacterium]